MKKANLRIIEIDKENFQLKKLIAHIKKIIAEKISNLKIDLPV